MIVTFSEKDEEHFDYWQENDKKILAKIETIIQNMMAMPKTGLGKPEQLRHNLSGLWSRRINLEHRIVYEIIANTDTNEITELVIYSLKGHYNDI